MQQSNDESFKLPIGPAQTLPATHLAISAKENLPTAFI
jgi:hypothetical protein